MYPQYSAVAPYCGAISKRYFRFSKFCVVLVEILSINCMAFRAVHHSDTKNLDSFCVSKCSI